MLNLFGPYGYRDLAPSMAAHVDFNGSGSCIYTRWGDMYVQKGMQFHYAENPPKEMLLHRSLLKRQGRISADSR